MAAPKSTSVAALARLRGERDAFDRREREARDKAASELGEAVLKAAGVELDPVQVGKLVSATMKHGFEASMALLSPTVPPRKGAVVNGNAGHQSRKAGHVAG